MSSMIDKTNIFYFDKDSGEKVKLKDCTINKTFMYKRCNFTVVNKNGYFYFCYIDENGDLYSIWCKYDIIDGELMSDTQMMSLFRKEFDKNNIDKTLIEKFIQKPLSFSLLTPKGKRNKNLRATK